MKDAFQRRLPQTQRYTGRLCNHFYDAAYAGLINDGWTVTVFRNGRQVTDWSIADPEKGEVTAGGVALKGNVEIRMTRPVRVEEVT